MWVIAECLRFKSYGTADVLPLGTHLGLLNKPLILDEKDPQSVFMAVVRDYLDQEIAAAVTAGSFIDARRFARYRVRPQLLSRHTIEVLVCPLR